MRAIITKIVNAMKNSPRDVKLSVRDKVVVNNDVATYVLWHTPIVELNRITGEVWWNTSEFKYRYTRTTQNRITSLQYFFK